MTFSIIFLSTYTTYVTKICINYNHSSLTIVSSIRVLLQAQKCSKSTRLRPETLELSLVFSGSWWIRTVSQ